MERQQCPASPRRPIYYTGTRLGTLCLHTMHLMSRPCFPFEDWFSALKTSRDLLTPACDDKDTRTLTGTSSPRPLCPQSREDGATGSHQITRAKHGFRKYGLKMNTGTPLCECKRETFAINCQPH